MQNEKRRWPGLLWPWRVVRALVANRLVLLEERDKAKAKCRDVEARVMRAFQEGLKGSRASQDAYDRGFQDGVTQYRRMALAMVEEIAEARAAEGSDEVA